VVEPRGQAHDGALGRERHPPHRVIALTEGLRAEEDGRRARLDGSLHGLPALGAAGHSGRDQDHLWRGQISPNERPVPDAVAREPVCHRRVVAGQHHGPIDGRHVSGIEHAEAHIAARGRTALAHAGHESVLPRRAVDLQVLGEHGDREGRFLPLGDPHGDCANERARHVRADDRQVDRVLTRLQGVLVGQHGLEPDLAPAIDRSRLGEQAQPQRSPGVEQRVNGLGLQLAEGREQALARHALIYRAGEAVADDRRVGANGVQPVEPVAGHLPLALEEEVVRPGEALGERPLVPVDHELVELVPVELGILDLGLPEPLVVPRRTDQIDGAAHTVLGDEHGLPALAEGPQGVDDRQVVRHPLVGMLVGHGVFPRVGARVAQGAELLLSAHRLRHGEALEGRGIRLLAGGEPAVVPRRGLVALGHIASGGVEHLIARADGQRQRRRIGAVAAIPVAHGEVQRVSLAHGERALVLGSRAAGTDVDEAVPDRIAGVQHVHIRRRTLGDGREHGLDGHLTVDGADPPQRTVLAVLAGVQRQLPGLPRDTQAPDDAIGAVPGDARVNALRRLADLEPRHGCLTGPSP